MKKVLLLLLGFLLLASGDTFAKSQKSSRRPPGPPPAKKEQEIRREIDIPRGDVSSDRNLRRHVKHYSGDIWISGIPMYDQGNRPECAIAVVRRLLDYYASGNRVNMNALRQALGYDKRKGTDVWQMVAAIQKYSRQLHLNFQPIYDYMTTVQDIQEELKKYNRYASKNHAIDIPRDIRSVDGFSPFVKKIDFSAWSKMRTSEQRREQAQAWKQIVRQIDQGIPVVWGVYLGLAREQGVRQSNGGHLRLIIGYNAAKGRIIYSDSWGRGHEKKEMPWNAAWAITWNLFVLRPIN
ncbi:MAG: C39 family peptidase [Victivallales bacterium]|nr:C39 family peptidase [Victivallales bacterium]